MGEINDDFFMQENREGKRLLFLELQSKIYDMVRRIHNADDETKNKFIAGFSFSHELRGPTEGIEISLPTEKGETNPHGLRVTFELPANNSKEKKVIVIVGETGSDNVARFSYYVITPEHDIQTYPRPLTERERYKAPLDTMSAQQIIKFLEEPSFELNLRNPNVDELKRLEKALNGVAYWLSKDEKDFKELKVSLI